MAPMLDQEQKIRLVERALYDQWRTTSTTEVIATDSWVQVTTPTVKTLFKNGIFRSLLEPSEADARIASTIDWYQSRQLPLWWIVSPSSRPGDLSQRLLRAGFRLTHTAIGMFVDLDRIHIPLDESINVKQVDEGDCEDWLATQARVWDEPPESVRASRAVLKKTLASNDRRVIHFVARVDGETVGVGSVYFYSGVAYLLNASVLPEYRMRGVFRAILAYGVGALRERGTKHAVIHAIKDASAPILQRLGAEGVCEIHYYAYP
jgi:hypothetical protein